RRVRRREAVLGDAEEHRVRVVPRMSCRVVRRCGKASVRQPFLPLGLAFEGGAVARRAMLPVELLAKGQGRLCLAAGEQRRCDEEAPHATRMNAAIPVAWCSSTWQWSIQSPGLSATSAISARLSGSRSTVSAHWRGSTSLPLFDSSRKTCPCKCI